MDPATSRVARPVGLFLAVATLIGIVWTFFTEVPTLEKLSDAQLIKEYEAAGVATAKTRDKLTDGSMSANPGIPDRRLCDAQMEILRRGEKIVPALTVFLEKEAPKERQKEEDEGQGLSLTADVLGLLTEIGDPRSVPVILRILEGWDGQVNRFERWASLSALEEITMVCFHKIGPWDGPYRESVEHPDAIAARRFEEYDTPARLYRQWLQGEGKDSSQWTAMARKRARQWLSSADIGKVYCAAEFLRPEAGRDDAPDATLARLVQVVETMKKNPAPGGYDIGNPASWTAYLTNYGPRARPYSAFLLDFQKARGPDNGYGIIQLRKVGGPEIMAYFFETLSKVGAEIEKITGKPDGNKSYSSKDPEAPWRDAQRELRYGIDRWAGRSFESDAERQAWWEENKSKSPREWLEASLDVMPDQVDRRMRFAEWIAHDVLPDLPGDPFAIRKYSSHRAVKPLSGSFLAAWLATHRKALRYDENAGCFRVGS